MKSALPDSCSQVPGRSLTRGGPSFLDALLDGYRRLEAGGVTHILTLPWVFYHGMTENLDEKIDGLQRFAADFVETMLSSRQDIGQ